MRRYQTEQIDAEINVYDLRRSSLTFAAMEKRSFIQGVASAFSPEFIQDVSTMERKHVPRRTVTSMVFAT